MPNDHHPTADPGSESPTSEIVAEPLRPSGHATSIPERDTLPTPSNGAVAFSGRTPGPSRLRLAVVAGAVVVLVVGAVATSVAASPGPSAGANTAVTNGQATGPGTPSGAGVGSGPLNAVGPMSGPDEDTLDHLGRGGMGFRDITIASISGNDVTLKTDDGWTRTITVTSSVKLTKGGQEIAVSDLKVGDQVRIDQTRNDDGTYTVNGLVVVVPVVHGTASAVSASGFKVTTRDGSIWTITVDGSTKYDFGAGTGSLADVKDGGDVTVQGTKTGDNAMTALRVSVAPDGVMGTVKSTTSDSIVITRRDGTTVTVHVDADTTYRIAGTENAKLSDIKADMGISVSGRERSDGSIDADTVFAGTRGFGKGFGGFGGFGGRGHGNGWGPGTKDASPSASPGTSS